MGNKRTVEKIQTDLDLNEDLHLQEKGWALQRVGWIFIILIMIAGVLGVFGGGMISSKKLSSGTIKAEFEQFFRYDVEMKILLEATEHIGSISLPQEYLKDFREVRFVPEPVNSNTINTEVLYNFLPGTNRIVTIYLKPEKYGTISGTLKVNGTSNFNLSHFIYP